MTHCIISEGTRIKMHFALKLENGETVDSNFDKAPVTFDFGDGNLPEGFQNALLGLAPGEHACLTIAPERGFGMHNPANIQVMKKTQFNNHELELGMVHLFQEPGGEVPGVIVAIEDDRVSVDFNHPLSGQTLLFEVNILTVERIAGH